MRDLIQKQLHLMQLLTNVKNMDQVILFIQEIQKRKNAEILNEFSKLSCGVVHSSKSLIQGVDVPRFKFSNYII